MIDQEHQVRIVLTSIISKLEKEPIPCLDAEVQALLTVFKCYNLNDLKERYINLQTDEYMAKIQANPKQYLLYIDYAMKAIERATLEHDRIHSVSY